VSSVRGLFKVAAPDAGTLDMDSAAIVVTIGNNDLILTRLGLWQPPIAQRLVHEPPPSWRILHESTIAPELGVVDNQSAVGRCVTQFPINRFLTATVSRDFLDTIYSNGLGGVTDAQ
jgi:hypothetical protein